MSPNERIRMKKSLVCVCAYVESMFSVWKLEDSGFKLVLIIMGKATVA